MKKNAILINVARGAVCDEKALAEAIKNDKIGMYHLICVFFKQKIKLITKTGKKLTKIFTITFISSE